MTGNGGAILSLLLLLFLPPHSICVARADDGVAFFTTGKCTVNSTCVMSPNYPDDYNRNDDCVITVERDGVLDVEAFDLEKDADFLTVNDVKYTDTAGPEGVAVAAGDVMEFTSDGTGQYSGFDICWMAPPTPRCS